MAKKSSILEQLLAEAAPAAKAVANDTAKKPVATAVEMAIDKNPVYQVLNKDLDDAQIIDEIGKLLAYDPALSKEENLAKAHAMADVNRHFQEQMISLARRLAKFTNDESMSLYDETVEKLQVRLHDFAGAINPLVHALSVIKKAEDDGKDPQDLIGEVVKMRALAKELDKKAKELAAQRERQADAIKDSQGRANAITHELEKLKRRKEDEDTDRENNIARKSELAKQ